MARLTWSNTDKTSSLILTNENLTVSGNVSNSTNMIRATRGKTRGKWYWEININSGSSNAFGFGVGNKSLNLTAVATDPNLRIYWNTGVKYPSNTSYASSFSIGDTIGIALDLDNGTLEFHKNGVSQGVSHTDVLVMGEVFPLFRLYSGQAEITANFGATPFIYPMPTGFAPYGQLNKTLIQSTSGEHKYWVDQKEIANFSFDEPSGNVIDSIDSSVIGTINGGVTRVNGWNDEGSALSFNSKGSSVSFNQKAIPYGKKTIMFYIKKNTPPSETERFINNTVGTVSGMYVAVTSNGRLLWRIYNGNSGNIFSFNSNLDICDNQWHRIMLTWDGTTGINSAKIYVDDMLTPKSVTTASSIETNNPYSNLLVGAMTVGTSSYAFTGQIDNLEIYNEVYNPLTDETWQAVPNNPPTKSDFETYGLDDLSTIPESAWRKLFQESEKIKLATYVPDGNIFDEFESVEMSKGLSMRAVPKPQFIKLVSPKNIYGKLDDIVVNDISESYRDEARYFISGIDSLNWYVWSKEQGKFVSVDTSTDQTISLNGMTHKDIENITNEQWNTWEEKYLNIGIFLKDNPRDTIVSIVGSLSYEDYLPRHTSTVEDADFYILNTTAKIDVSFNGNVLKGILSDADLTRVQYRVLLNGKHYYPSDGNFTKLGESPQNIELSISSRDIKVDDWNTLKIEFQDFFGTTDYWQTNFIGTYSGLMFKDIYGQYYSSEIGEILQLLDFGIIIAGQTTIEHEIVLKNQYGYDVKNIHIYANTSNFPTGMACEFSTSLSPFAPQPDLMLSRTLVSDEEMSFFVRLKTELGATPDVNGSFDIIVRADKA